MADLDRLKARIAALRAKTLENGCTEPEALLAAAKVAELLDRHALSLGDVEIRAEQCERRVYEDKRNKRLPIGDCIGAIAAFCDCRVWREKGATKAPRYVFFGLPADVDAAHYLAELIDHSVRSELGRFKISPAYKDFRHADRHLANASFALGMMASMADKLIAMKAARRTGSGSGRDIFVLKTSLVDAELKGLDVSLREVMPAPRMIAPDAYEAGEIAGAGVAINGR